MSGLRLCLYEEPTNVVKQIEKSKHKSLQQTIANSHLNIDLAFECLFMLNSLIEPWR